MKLILAIIQPSKLEAVKEALNKVEVFRLIVSGTAYYNGVPLTAGDWMVVPAGESYSLTAADNPGYVSYHLYW